MSKEIWLAAAALSTAVACGGEINDESHFCVPRTEAESAMKSYRADELGRIAVDGFVVFVPIEALTSEAEVSDFVCVPVAEAVRVEES